MIEVKDEVLNGEPLYRIKDTQGNILQDNVTIEMITQLIQAGTPINKLLFDNIQKEIHTKIDKRESIMQYNKPIHSFETNSYLKTYTNSYIGEDGSATFRGNSDAPSNIDSTGTTYKDWNLIDIGEYTIITLDKAIVLKKISIRKQLSMSGITINYKIEASFDGTNYDFISSEDVIGTATTISTIDMSNNTKEYKYIKFTCVSSSNVNNLKYIELNNFRIQEIYKTDKLSNLLEVPVEFDKRENQRLLVEIPEELDSNLPTYVIPNSEEKILIIGTLKSNKKYELVYNNENFSLIEISENINTEIENIKNAIIALGGSL